jgi:putative N-acetylmannosamine-6-phosphate epimerase
MSSRVHAALIGINIISTISILAKVIYKNLHQYSMVDASALRDAHTAHMAAADFKGTRHTWQLLILAAHGTHGSC